MSQQDVGLVDPGIRCAEDSGEVELHEISDSAEEESFEQWFGSVLLRKGVCPGALGLLNDLPEHMVNDICVWHRTVDLDADDEWTCEGHEHGDSLRCWKLLHKHLKYGEVPE